MGASGSIGRAPPPREEPPAGPPWDDPLDRAPLAFVDLEMTGLDPARDRIVEVCVERTAGDAVADRIETLVRPEPAASGNVHIHGLGPDELAGAPTFAEVAGRVEALLDGAVLVAHGAAWDVAFLEAELARIGRPRRFVHYLDTLELSQRALALPSHSLSALSAELGLVRIRAHRAGDDVAALRAVFRHVCSVLSPRSPRDLWHVRVGRRHARPEVLAAALAAADRGEPVVVRYRPAHRGAEELLFQVTGVRTDLDPPRVLGYLLPSRGRRELRADRILSLAQPGPASAKS